jgi:hypothetical protein
LVIQKVNSNRILHLSIRVLLDRCVLGLVSAMLVGIRSSSSLLDKSHSLKDNWPDPEAIVEGKRLWLRILPGDVTGNS